MSLSSSRATCSNCPKKLTSEEVPLLRSETMKPARWDAGSSCPVLMLRGDRARRSYRDVRWDELARRGVT